MSRELFSRKWDRMTLEEQKEYRDRKLSHFVRTQLYPYSPFYRKLFDENGVSPGDIRSVEDLGRLPFTYKADIAPTAEDPERFRRFVLEPDAELIDRYMPRSGQLRLTAGRVFQGGTYLRKYIWANYRPVHLQFTTGHTGFPTPILYARSDMELMAEAGRRILALAGFGDRIHYDEALVMNAMPFAPHLGFWMVSTMLERAGVLSFNSGGGRALGTGRILGAMESMKANGLIGMPGYVYHLLRTAVEQGRDLSSLRLVLVAGERIPGGMKEKMGEYLDALGAREYAVLGSLGFTEARKAYSECFAGADAGYHLYPDLDYFELVDPETEKPVAEGEGGELVYSCLDGRGTCVLRFRTGDYVKGGIVSEPCPACGRTVPRLSSDIIRSGREKGFSLTKIKGTLVDQGAFFTILDDNPGVLDWQVEIRKAMGDPFEVDEVDIAVAPAEGVDGEALKAGIESSVQAAIEVKPNSVTLLPLDELVERLRSESGMKELRVVDRRPS